MCDLSLLVLLGLLVLLKLLLGWCLLLKLLGLRLLPILLLRLVLLLLSRDLLLLHLLTVRVVGLDSSLLLDLLELLLTWLTESLLLLLAIWVVLLYGLLRELLLASQRGNLLLGVVDAELLAVKVHPIELVLGADGLSKGTKVDEREVLAIGLVNVVNQAELLNESTELLGRSANL